MSDGSIFKMPNSEWQEAFDMKYSEEDLKEIKKAFIKLTEEHWKVKTIPTKFDWDEKWKNAREYKNHAELAEHVMYKYIRAALMGLMFNKMSKGKGRVLGIDEDGNEAIYPPMKEGGKAWQKKKTKAKKK
jgi:thymidylate synthase ThyX